MKSMQVKLWRTWVRRDSVRRRVSGGGWWRARARQAQEVSESLSTVEGRCAHRVWPRWCVCVCGSVSRSSHHHSALASLACAQSWVNTSVSADFASQECVCVLRVATVCNITTGVVLLHVWVRQTRKILSGRVCGSRVRLHCRPLARTWLCGLCECCDVDRRFGRSIFVARFFCSKVPQTIMKI